MRGQKGITLVALVITIIVMLILAGVTISIVINGGLFNQAEAAVSDTKKAAGQEEVEMAISTVVGKYYSSLYGESATMSMSQIESEIVSELNDSKYVTAAVSGNSNGTVTLVAKGNSGVSGNLTITIDGDTGSIKIGKPW